MPVERGILGIDNVNVLKQDPDPIDDMEDYVRDQQKQGKTKQEVVDDLRGRGYDLFTIEKSIILYWTFPDDE